MAEVHLFTAATIDGYITGPNEDISWLFSDMDYGYYKFFERVSITLSGYKTYQTTLGFGEPFPNIGKKNYVFSRSAKSEAPHVEFIRENPADFTRKLKEQHKGLIWLIGGGEINTILLQAGLIDEIILSVHPVVLGAGTQLFPDALTIPPMKLINIQTFPSGLVQSTYRPNNMIKVS